MLKENYLKIYPNVGAWDQEYQEDFFNKMHSLIPNKENISEQQKHFLKELSNSLLKIDEILQIFNSYGFKYNFGIAGGAIRDFLMNKIDMIGDLDIIVNFTNIIPGYNQTIWDSIDDLEKKGIELKRFLSDYFPNKPIFHLNTKIFSELINEIIKKQYTTKLFLSSNEKVDEYQNAHIYSIIKINDNHFFKPVDIILSKDSASVFMNTFSFDLCKGVINYSSDLKLEEKDGYLNLLDNIVLSKQMIHDIEKKQMTMNLQSLNEEHITYYMNKHYLKMKKKYPDFALNYRINFNVIDPNKIEKAKNLEKLVRYYMMKEKLPLKNESIISIKKKI